MNNNLANVVFRAGQTDGSVSHLCVVVVGPFVVGQLQLAKRDFLPHPVSTSVRRFRVNIHLVA